MILLEDVLFIHEELINKYGGTHGLRDQSLLESALQRPFTTYDAKDLYPTPITKAAALLESIVCNHPFIDGNKRIGYFLFRAYLLEHGLDIVLTQDQKYNFIIDVATSKLKGDSLLLFIKENIQNE